MPEVHGATPDVWAHFCDTLGLTEHLLPVVSNPDAPVSKRSRLKSLGKTPSVYDADRCVVGLPGWPRRFSTPGEIARWAADSDLGVCVQGRAVRALDIDVDDEALADQIEELARVATGADFPVRYRPGSGKRLLPFLLEGELRKRVVSLGVLRGVVEVLGDGNQWIAYGRHPKGAKYVWRGGLPPVIPALTLGALEDFTNALACVFGAERVGGGGLKGEARRVGPDVDRDDPVAAWLKSSDDGIVVGEGAGGELLLQCPWEAEHSGGETGDGSTAWFLAGTRGYDRGGFKCLHAHCADRATEAFLAEIGYADCTAEDFDDMGDGGVGCEGGAGRVGVGSDEPLDVTRDKKGRIKPTLANLRACLRHSETCGLRLGYDDFLADEVASEDGGVSWRSLADADYAVIRARLEKAGLSMGKNDVRDYVLLTCAENRFDSGAAALEALEWDGVERVSGMLHRYFKTVDTPYAAALGRYLMTALAGRTLSPGCKVDMMPVLVGAQGVRKSSAVAALALAPEHFVELSFHERDVEQARKMRGKTVAEVAELKGKNSREDEDIKAWVTRAVEEIRPAYKERVVRIPRRLVMIGTTNNDVFLSDRTGGRRWLPIRVGLIDVDGLIRDRAQLWAEGAALWRAAGVMFKDADALAHDAREAHTEDDVMMDDWLGVVADWLNTPDALSGGKPGGGEQLRSVDIAAGALMIPARQYDRRASLRLSRVMRDLGWEMKVVRVEGQVAKVWRRKA